MNRPSLSRCQQGATLIISMVLLAVMAMFAITTLRTAILEERMSSATRERDLAFQSAEAGLRLGEEKAEKWARDEIPGRDPPSDSDLPKKGDGCDIRRDDDGLYMPAPDCPKPLWSDDYVDATGKSFWYRVEAGDVNTDLSPPPYYIVEYLSGTAPCKQVENPEKECKRFRITSSSEIANEGAYVMLQSIYAPE